MYKIPISDRTTDLNIAYVENTQNSSTKCQTMIGPNKTCANTKYVISKTNGSMGIEEKCLDNSRTCI